MNIIKDIIADYENLIKTSIQIPLSNGDVIRFAFHPQDLPHLLGLQHLMDIPILFEYREKRLSAMELYRRMISSKEDAIDTDAFEKSIYFDKLYNGRIQYFNSITILDIIQSRQIVKFDSAKIKDFPTKLDKIEYMFWKRYKVDDGNYGYFGIGFMSSAQEKNMNYPNTFFFRADDVYIKNQEEVTPYSIMKKNKYRVKTFEIYWDQVWKGLEANKHYKKIKNILHIDAGRLHIENDADEDARKQYELLLFDALDKVYLPYMKMEFRWTNQEKRFILQKIQEKRKNLFPNEILQLLNEYRQSQIF